MMPGRCMVLSHIGPVFRTRGELKIQYLYDVVKYLAGVFFSFVRTIIGLDWVCEIAIAEVKNTPLTMATQILKLMLVNRPGKERVSKTNVVPNTGAVNKINALLRDTISRATSGMEKTAVRYWSSWNSISPYLAYSEVFVCSDSRHDLMSKAGSEDSGARQLFSQPCNSQKSSLGFEREIVLEAL
jgi:hypothetical protein